MKRRDERARERERREALKVTVTSDEEPSVKSTLWFSSLG